MNKYLFLIILALCSGCNSKLNENDFLKKISAKLDMIKSASYASTQYGSIPGDTAMFSEPRTRHYKVFTDPSDTFVGASTADFSLNDTTKMKEFYDGKVRGTVFWEKEYVRIDSFKNNPAPFRLVYYPFYTKINEIIKYTLTTKDSIRQILLIMVTRYILV